MPALPLALRSQPGTACPQGPPGDVLCSPALGIRPGERQRYLSGWDDLAISLAERFPKDDAITRLEGAVLLE